MLASGSAMASSIQPIESYSKDSAGSVISESCDHCPALSQPIAKKSYIVPELKPGTQVMEIRDIDGQRKIARTEAWMGGSPVTFISKATPEALAAAGEQSDGVDLTATAAVTPVANPAPAATPPLALNVTNFQLRLN
jgi:hypothetical protein